MYKRQIYILCKVSESFFSHYQKLRKTGGASIFTCEQSKLVHIRCKFMAHPRHFNYTRQQENARSSDCSLSAEIELFRRRNRRRIRRRKKFSSLTYDVVRLLHHGRLRRIHNGADATTRDCVLAASYSHPRAKDTVPGEARQMMVLVL